MPTRNIKPFCLVTWVLLILNSWFCFADTKEVTRVPFKMFGEHIFIRVNINGQRNLDFIFDTGASSTVIGDQAAERMGLRQGKESTVMGAGGNKKVVFYDKNTMKIKNLHFDNVVLIRASLSHLKQRIGRRIDGIVGYPFLCRYALFIDYDKQELIFYPANHPGSIGNGQQLKLRISKIGVPFIMAKLVLPSGKRLYGYFLLDTGAGHTLIINTPFVQKYGLLKQIGNSYSVHLFGLSARVNPSQVGRIHEFTIGKYRLKNMPLACSQAQDGVSSLPQFAGLIGNALLRHFNIFMNLTQGIVIFQANSRYDQVFRVDCSGCRIGLAVRASRIQVMDVVKGSPAARAGLRVRDKILIVNGEWINPGHLLKLRRLFKEPQKRVSMVVRRSGRLIPVIFYTKPLI